MSEITRDDIIKEGRRRRAITGAETVEQVSQRIRIDYADGWFDMNEISTDGLLALLVTELQTAELRGVLGDALQSVSQQQGSDATGSPQAPVAQDSEAISNG